MSSIKIPKEIRKLDDKELGYLKDVLDSGVLSSLSDFADNPMTSRFSWLATITSGTVLILATSPPSLEIILTSAAVS